MANKFFIKDTGVLNCSGSDIIDFINRMSTNDFRKFSTGEFRKTILTTDKGRIIDIINFLNFDDEKIVLTSAGFEEKVISHLEKYIITDDVKLEKCKDAYLHFQITGENSFKVFKELLNSSDEPVRNKIYKNSQEDFIFYDDFKFDSINVICRDQYRDKILTVLKDFEEMDNDEYENFRIEKGIAEGKNELNDKINPMECGLEEFISFNKGCYIGQEVIARLDSQGKRPKQMVKIRTGDEISNGEKIFDSKEIESGFISSSVKYNNEYRALGFIRSQNLDFEHTYSVLHEDKKHQINISKIN